MTHREIILGAADILEAQGGRAIMMNRNDQGQVCTYDAMRIAHEGPEAESHHFDPVVAEINTQFERLTGDCICSFNNRGIGNEQYVAELRAMADKVETGDPFTYQPGVYQFTGQPWVVVK